MQNAAFRFFDLLLEMRNLVYDALTTDKSIRRPLLDFKDPIEMYVQTPPRYIPIMLANRQLSQEFEKQWIQTYSKDVTLAAIDRGPQSLRSPYNFVWPSELPRRCAQAVSECKVYAHLFCGVGQCPFHEAWESVPEDSDEDFPEICWAIEMLKPLVERMETSFLPQFSNLKHLDFKIAMWWPCEDGAFEWPDTPHGPEMKTWLDRLVSHPRCRSCEIVLVDADDEYEFWCHEDYFMGQSVQPYATWNREEGWKAGPARGPTLEFLEDIKDDEEE